jgi:tetratricopeptide (TPR) repeat protein
MIQKRTVVILAALVGLTPMHPALAKPNLPPVSLNQSKATRATIAEKDLDKIHALTEEGKYKTSIAALNDFLKREPKNSTVYLERAHAYYHMGKTKDALADINTAIQISPRNSAAYEWRAKVYDLLGQYPKELEDLTTAIKFDPGDAHLYESRGEVNYKLGQLQNAIDDCQMSIRKGHSCPDVNRTAANAYEELGLYEKAIPFRSEALTFVKTDPFDYGARAENHEVTGKLTLAQQDWIMALRRLPPKDKAEKFLCNPLLYFNLPRIERGREVILKQLKSEPVVLPFTYDSGGHICVAAEVNGQPLQLMLDTGCGHSDVWNHVMPKVAKVDDIKLQKHKANGEKFESGWFRAREFKLGDLVLSNVTLAANEGLSDHETLGGFLGGNILQNFAVTIDYTKKQAILAKSYVPVASKEQIVVPMILRTHQPHCRIKIDGKFDVLAIFDTGCPSNTSPDSLLKPVLPQKMQFKLGMTGPWLGDLSMERVRLKKIEFGGATFDNQLVDVFPAEEAPQAASELILGNSFLSQFKTVTFDYITRRIFLEPDEPSARSAPSLLFEGKDQFENQEYQNAVDTFTRVLKQEKDFSRMSLDYRASSLVNLNKYKEALEDINELIKLEPKYYRYYRNRAFLYEKLGKKDLAEADALTANKLDPSSKKKTK